MATRAFDADGLNYISNELQKELKTVLAKMKLLMTRLADYGWGDATMRFAKAVYDGRNDVVIGEPMWVDEKTLKITASGHAVCFIEFGTGVTFADDHPKMHELGFARGTYGKGHGKQRTWGYYGDPGTNGQEVLTKSGRKVVLTHGNPANRCLYETTKDMKSRIADLAREVFAQ